MSRRDRKLERRIVLQAATMVQNDGSMIGPCTMLDVSAGGARLKVASGGIVPEEFVLLLSQFAIVDHRGSAIGLVSVLAGAGDIITRTDSGPNPNLMRSLPGRFIGRSRAKNHVQSAQAI